MPFDVRRLGQGCPWPGSGRGPMGRDVPAISVSQQDRRAYREKVCCCLDVFARMLRESRFDTEPRHVGLEIELHMVDEAAALDEERRGTRRDRRPDLGQRARPVQPGDQRAAAAAGRRRPDPARAAGPGQPGPRRGPGPPDRQPAGAGRHPAHAARERRRRARHVAEPAVPAAERGDLRGPRRGDADLDRGSRAAAHPHRHDHPRGRLHQRAVPPAGEPGHVRQLLERGPGRGRRPGRRRRQLPVPVRAGAVA